MWIEMSVPSVGNSGIRRVRMSWNFKDGEWKVLEDPQQAWPSVGFADHGQLKRGPGGAIEMWDNVPGALQHLTAVFRSAPADEMDETHVGGFAQLCDPRTAEWHGYEVSWRAERREGEALSSLRQQAQAVLDAILPAYYLSPNYMANPYASKNWKAVRASNPRYTNCVEFPAYYAMQMGCKRKFWPGYPNPKTPGWKTPGKDGHPQAGDIYINCKTGVHDGSTAHIGVVRDTDYLNNSHGLIWRTGDYGQTAGVACPEDPSYQGGFDGIFLLQKYDPFADTLQQFSPGSKEARAIHAWIDIEEFYNS